MNISDKPYAEFLESAIKQLFTNPDLDPESIFLAVKPNEHSVASTYWNMNNSDRQDIIVSLIEDCLLDFIDKNKSMIREILNSGDNADE